ncbi:MAG TPA: acyl-CoA dehydrogenase family protein [Chloroflexota bacterium]|nr:acyl-CoA dehydrogenase family protein [Chloroflexota bacterium]
MAAEAPAAPVTLDDLVQRARALAPRLAERGEQAEQLRRMPDETIADFVDSGLLLPFVPARYGGFELDYGPVQLALCNELCRACGSSGWVQSVLACHAWILGMFPQAAQDAVWAKDRNTIVASAFAPGTGKAERADGGYVLDGTWQFSSGIHAADWLIVMIPVPGPEGVQMHFCLLPKKDYDILDTWHAAGLKATGSNDVRIHRAFVPDEFTLNVSIADGRPTPGSALSDSHIYRLPLWSVFSYNIGTPALGMARAALEGYIAASAGRPDREVAQGRHARIAESAADIDAAEALLLADCEEITRLGRSGEPIAVETRARWRRNMAYAVNVWTRAVDRLIGSVGAHGMSENSPVQRAFRDIHAVGNHTGLVWDNHGPLWGRIAMGLEPASIRALPIPV